MHIRHPYTVASNLSQVPEPQKACENIHKPRSHPSVIGRNAVARRKHYEEIRENYTFHMFL